MRHLPRLLRLQASLAAPPASRNAVLTCSSGVDAPEFNLGLAKRLQGARASKPFSTLARRFGPGARGGVRNIGHACDLVLCLLPFETAFYSRHGVPAAFVGHPLADEIPLEVDREGARAALGLKPSAAIVALLPGSRVEVERLATDACRPPNGSPKPPSGFRVHRAHGDGTRS